jgi:glycosyltransferase involved in cell wall biosynthesis
VVLVTHADGGGVERQVAARAARLQAEGARAIVVRPGPAPAPADDSPRIAPSAERAASGFNVCDGVAGMPVRVPTVEALADLLRDDRPTVVELHHVAAHDPAVLRLAGLLAVPFDVVVHDFAAVCPRVTLCGGAERYCGEPGDRRDCEDCIADHGARIPLSGTVAAHRARQAMLLCAARTVTAPSRDAADRLRRFVPSLAPVVTPWEDDAALTEAVRLPALPPEAAATVAVVGAIGIDKGYAVLLACARDAARRDLPLRFVVVGHTIDDDRLLATGRVFVTGRFAEGEAPALLAEFAPALGLLPSVWPETWCFALSALWQAGLHVLAFDLGAQAERITATGAGTLVPLGTGAAAINDRCLALLHPLPRTDRRVRPRLIIGGRQAHG